MQDNFLTEAERLYKIGFPIHWLYPNSKRPIEKGWTKGERTPWEVLKKKYEPGMNVGVRLGLELTPGMFLGVIDCDVKSEDPKHVHEMANTLWELFPELRAYFTPKVITGRGNNSCHFYVRTDQPIVPKRLEQSSEKVTLKMRVKGKLQDCIRPAWEISLMGQGQQVVLPPSVHPDTGKTYFWGHPARNVPDIFHLKDHAALIVQNVQSVQTHPFTRVDVDLVGSDLSDHIVDLILTGKGSKNGDRSSDAYLVGMAMVQAGMSDNEILSVLTEPGTYLGDAAIERRGVQGASNWVWEYVLEPAKEKVSASRVFAGEVKIEPPLSETEAKKQVLEVVGDEPPDWRLLLNRTKEGALKDTLKNVVLILSNDVGPKLFTRNAFAIRDAYGMDAPWLYGKKGKSLTDDDAILIRLWFAQKWGIEPSLNHVFEAMTAISIQNQFHPVRDYLGALEWDHTTRLDSALFKFFEAHGEKEYLAQVFRKFMVGAVARIMNPGVKFDWMLILEGAQGVGKSSFPKILAGEQWFVDWLPNLADKDAALGLQGIWFYEMGELSNLRRSEIEAVKGFVTRQIDKVRPPYGRKVMEIPRQCVFMGTTNKDEYLKDETGNRRFKPVVVGQLNFKELEKERDQLFAEAMFIYQNEFEKTLELEGLAIKFEAKIHAEKTVRDVSDSMVVFLERGNLPTGGLAISDLFSPGNILQKWKEDNLNMQYAAKALKAFGYEKYEVHGRSRWRKLETPPPFTPPLVEGKC